MRVKDGDVIQVGEKSRQIPMVLMPIESPERDVPEYIEVDYKAMKGTFIRTPTLADVHIKLSDPCWLGQMRKA